MIDINETLLLSGCKLWNEWIIPHKNTLRDNPTFQADSNPQTFLHLTFYFQEKQYPSPPPPWVHGYTSNNSGSEVHSWNWHTMHIAPLVNCWVIHLYTWQKLSIKTSYCKDSSFHNCNTCGRALVIQWRDWSPSVCLWVINIYIMKVVVSIKSSNNIKKAIKGGHPSYRSGFICEKKIWK